MKKIAAVSAVALLATAGAALGQNEFRVDYRILVQETTGVDAARVINPAADLQFNSGDVVRFTVQYMITDLRTAPGAGVAEVYGWTGTGFDILGSANAGANGVIQRSQLSTSGAPAPGGVASNGEADTNNNSNTWLNGQQYPQSGTSTSQSGLHNPFRFGLTADGTIPADQALPNGQVMGNNIIGVAPLQTGGGAIVNQLDGQWWGLYSFEYDSNAGFSGAVTFSLSNVSTAHQFYLGEADDASTASPILYSSVPVVPALPSFQIGAVPSVTVNFLGGTVNTPPAAVEPNGDPVNVTANPMVPDAVNLVLASFSDADAADTVDVTIVSDGGLGLVGGAVTITGDNGATPTIVLNGDFNNAAIGQSFVVSYTFTDATGPAQAATVTVTIVPAPGAAALLGLGGLLAARRRRA